MKRNINRLRALRRFSVEATTFGFGAGLMRGLASSTEVFDDARVQISREPFAGLQADKEAIKSDVERAKRELKPTIERWNKRREEFTAG